MAILLTGPSQLDRHDKKPTAVISVHQNPLGILYPATYGAWLEAGPHFFAVLPVLRRSALGINEDMRGAWVQPPGF